MSGASSKPHVAIACGGTGGHLFPGRAVADELIARGCDVTLIVSKKDVDRQAAETVRGIDVIALPAVAFGLRRLGSFLRGLNDATRAAREYFLRRPPQAILSMGGFTSLAPALAARRLKAGIFIHEANAVPGRANRWLAHVARGAFVYFPEATGRLSHQQVRVTGMPVRSRFRPLPAWQCRQALGLDPGKPVLLVTGGSQGAAALNAAVLGLLPALSRSLPELQFVHLTGTRDEARVAEAYSEHGRRAFVRPFFDRMELALGAASLAIGRAGASSLAEQAAMRVPSILVPYPAAADDHQFYNARAFALTTAGRMLVEKEATAEALLREVRSLLRNEHQRRAIQAGLSRWHFADAAVAVALPLLRALCRDRETRERIALGRAGAVSGVRLNAAGVEPNP